MVVGVCSGLLIVVVVASQVYQRKIKTSSSLLGDSESSL
jgi:hypothetical protein